MAKESKSLLNKAPTKVKNKIKTTTKKTEYKFSIGDRVYYIGISYEDYQNQECTIIKRSRQHIDEYYKIEFSDGLNVQVPRDTLRSKEEFELEQVNKDGDETDDDNEISEVERKIIESGLTPLKNRTSCMNSPLFVERGCDRCKKEPVCIYRKKYQYDRIKLN